MLNVPWSMKLVSGGQTGADRAAVDLAIDKKIKWGGWVPAGRRAEDGTIDPSYSSFKEASSSKYADRTRLNVRDSDGTVIFAHGELIGGTALTAQYATELGKPLLTVDLDASQISEAASKTARLIRKHEVRILNVAGPRASEDPEVYDAVYRILTSVFD